MLLFFIPQVSARLPPAGARLPPARARLLTVDARLLTSSACLLTSDDAALFYSAGHQLSLLGPAALSLGAVPEAPVRDSCLLIVL